MVCRLIKQAGYSLYLRMFRLRVSGNVISLNKGIAERLERLGLMNTFDRLKDNNAGSASNLAGLGDGKIAYVKPMSSDDIRRLFPEAPALEPGLQLFALVGANGVPILVADTLECALANAWEKQLVTMSVH